jgi:hypothetical protein
MDRIAETPAVQSLPMELVRNCRVLPERGAILSRLPRDIVFAEIGVGLGDFTVRVLEACSVKQFIAIDIFAMHHYPETWDGYVGRTLNGMDHRSFYERRFNAEIKGGRLKILEGDSREHLEELPDRSVDVFYVDADHTYQSVRAELELIKRKIVPGGVIILNDYTLADSYGVIQAANEFMIKWGWEMIFFALQPQMFCDIAIRELGRGDGAS